MKSFNEFKVDCFITEGAAEKLAAMSPEQIADYKKSNPGAASKVDELLKKAKTTKVPGSTFRGGATPPSGGAPRPPAGAPAGGGTPPRPGAMVQSPGGKLVKAASQEASAGAKAATNAAAKEVEKAAVKTAGKGILKGLGRVVGPASALIDVADERSKGSGWLRSLARGATVAAGSALGGAAGSAAGPVGTVAGGVAGATAASKAFDTVAGANAVERKAIATANRKGQAGGALKGIGGKTTFDTKKNTITTGTGAQRKTAQLGKTSVVTDPKTGKQEVGNLAYQGGKAVYKRSDTKSLAQTSSNPLERIGRSLFAGAYKQSDAANAAKKLATARQSDASRNKALGVRFGPGK
jgi:hypothetical protein